MIRRTILMMVLMTVGLSVAAQNVTIKAVNQPAATVFRSIIGQTGKNFVYSSDLLSDLKVTVDVTDKPLKSVLDDIFRDTGISYSIRGNNVVLKRSKKARKVKVSVKRDNDRPFKTPQSLSKPNMFDEVEVVSRLEAPAVETAEMGARKVTGADIRNIPVLLGESDVIKALHTQPGVTEGTEGMAGMYVHGGNADENLCMLDNVPLYQVNHFGGLFSAFNSDIIRYIDFFKTSMPAKYDGRLSSFLDVRLQNGSPEGHHGSARIGLTSGAFNISGPIGGKTTYMVGLRRSWYDVLTIPVIALVNYKNEDEKTRFRYAFMDLNAKISHRFSSKVNGFVSAYYGCDELETGWKDAETSQFQDEEKYDFHWGNFVAQTGLNYRVSPTVSAEFTAAYTRYFSSLSYDSKSKEDGVFTRSLLNSDNNITDWIFRGDFDWNPSDDSRVRFGANYVHHSFLPVTLRRKNIIDDSSTTITDSTATFRANEVNLYIDDDWRITDRLRVNVGLHGSLFHIDGRTRGGLSPRLSVNWRFGDNFSVKAAYSRTVQYVHQLVRSYLSLPTDQWLPVTGDFKPKTADKVAVGGYWQTDRGDFTVSVEAYYKSMHNLLDYCDEYYLKPPFEAWNARLTTGRGTAKGIDLNVEKTIGKVTGHLSYSLAWADRQFADKNGGAKYPARFDNRHTVNISASWRVNDKVTLNAAWVGHSGNRFTFMPQEYEVPGSFGNYYYSGGTEVPLKTSVNNYQLPFYHRLDLSCMVRNSRGYWSFGLYNAYCHMNTVAIVRGYRDDNNNSWPVFQKVKLFPVIPSISYTWQF